MTRMTEMDFAEIMDKLESAYGKDLQVKDKAAFDLWYSCLKDIPKELCEAAVVVIITTSKWCPKIADIREAAINLVQKNESDWSQEWDKVIRAIGRFGQNRQEEAMEYMGEKAAEIVKRMGWKTICMSEKIEVERANFRDIFIASQKQRKIFDQIPAINSNDSIGNRIEEKRKVKKSENRI